MIVRLIPEQITIFWDAIRHAAIQSNGVTEDQAYEYGKNLLLKLLSEKAQAWLIYDYVDDKKIDKQVHGIGITELTHNQGTGVQALLLSAIYVFRPTSEQDYKEAIDEVKKFGKNAGCTEMFTYSHTERQFHLMEDVAGFKMRCKQFVTEL